MIIIQSLTGTTIEGETVAYLQSDVVDSDGLIRVNNATANIIIRLSTPIHQRRVAVQRRCLDGYRVPTS